MVASLGAEGTNAGTSNELTVYINKIPSNQLDKWLTPEKERFSQLVFRRRHGTEAYTKSLILKTTRTQDHLHFMDALFQPTMTTTLLEKPELKNPSMVAIHNYFDTYYVPNNMAVILVGDLDLTRPSKKSTPPEVLKKELSHPNNPKSNPLVLRSK